MRTVESSVAFPAQADPSVSAQGHGWRGSASNQSSPTCARADGGRVSRRAGQPEVIEDQVLDRAKEGKDDFKAHMPP